MKQFCPFPKILVFLILGLVNFTAYGTNRYQYPAVKESVTKTYPNKPDMALSAFTQDIKERKEIFNSTPSKYFLKIADNYYMQSGILLTEGQVYWILMDTLNQLEIRKCRHDSVINSASNLTDYGDCKTEEDCDYVFFQGFIMLKLGDKCFNPARLKYPPRKTQQYVASEPYVLTPAPQQVTITPIEENDYVVVKEEITPEQPPIQTQGNQSGNVVNNIKIRNNNNDWSGFWGAVGQIGSALLYSNMGQQCCDQPIIQTNPRQCPVGQHWVPYPRDPRNGRCVYDVTYGTGGLPSTNPGTVGNGGLPGTTTGTTNGNGGLPGTGNGGLPGMRVMRRR